MYERIEEQFKGYTTYLCKEKIGTSTYYLYLHTDNSVIYVTLSSGKKRKHRSVFEEKIEKSDGGIKALLWAVSAMLTFQEESPYGRYKDIIICPSDSRRRRIYKRLFKYGFIETKDRELGMIFFRKSPEKISKKIK